MPARSTYTAGTPSWVELRTPDPAGSAAFYRGLFGWETIAAGDYTVFTLDDKAVAGRQPATTSEAEWTACICVSDAAATAGVAPDAGGRVVAPVADVPEVARVAVLADPEGASLTAWEPTGRPGADLVNEPGTFCFTELGSANPADAAVFYQTLFGWEAESYPMPGGSYTEWDLDGRVIAGMVDTSGAGGPPRRPGWTVYFAVADCDAAADTGGKLGGAVTVPPTDIPPGRHAIIRDPQGATFAVIHLTHAVQ